MATGTIRYLSIYCLCGQKMKVSADMFGLSAKCVACRQKIRIPEASEIPEDCMEIRLEAHPEFLREPPRHATVSRKLKNEAPATPPKSAPEQPSRKPSQRHKTPKVKPPRQAGNQTVVAKRPAFPLDVFEPLQRLCSFDRRIAKQISKLGDTPDEAELEKLTKRKALSRRLRAKLDETMREALQKCGEEIEALKENDASALLAVRVGDMEFSEYASKTRAQRQRRETMRRHRENLQGWLTLSDPHTAGGYVDVSLEELPDGEYDVSPLDHSDSVEQSVAERLRADLREALLRQEHAERHVKEWKAMQEEGAISEEAVKNRLTDSRATRARARAAVVFFRERLEKVTDDLDTDQKAVEAARGMLKMRLEKGEFSKNVYEALAKELDAAAQGIAADRAIVAQSLDADRSADLPLKPNEEAEPLWDSSDPDEFHDWSRPVALGVAGMFFVAGVLNFVIAPFPEMAALLFGTGLLLAGGAFIPHPLGKALALSTLVLAYVLGAVWAINHAWYGAAAIGAAIRTATPWYLHQSVLLAACCAAAALAAAIAGTLPLPRWRLLPIPVSLVAMVMAVFLFTGMAGANLAKPILDPVQAEVSPSNPGQYDVTVRIANLGARSFWLGGKAERSPTPVSYSLRRMTFDHKWQEMGLPLSMQTEKSRWASKPKSNVLPEVEIQPGDAILMSYALQPGQYEAKIDYSIYGQIPKSQPFSLGPSELSSPPPAAPPAAVPAETVTPPPVPGVPVATQEPFPVPGETNASSPPVQPSPNPAEPAATQSAPPKGIQVELQAVMHNASGSPSFRLILYFPDGRREERTLRIGQVIEGPWKTAEYNPDRKTLTVSNGDQLLVIETKKLEFLEIPDK